MMSMNVYTQHASDRQLQYLKAVDSLGSQEKAAKALGVTPATIERSLRALRAKVALKGHAPGHFNSGVAPGFNMGKVTVQRGPGGDVERTWERQHPAFDPEAVKAAIEAMRDDIKKAKPRPAPLHTINDLLNCYIVTDYHLGMLAWGEETGADWDTDIATEMLVSWFAYAIKQAPAAEVGMLAQLGDFLHWDGWDAVTPASRHLLDADTRFPRLVRVAIKAVRQVIKMMLDKYPQVHVIMAEGNHDPSASVWLREMCAIHYEDEPRVTVDIRPDPYYSYEWDQTLLLFHHGHKRKPTNIDTTFVAKFREAFGRTSRAYAHMGHLHHIDQKETNLMVVEQHRTLASPDAYSSRGGWISGRDAQVITYHKRYGERTRQRIPAQLITELYGEAA